MILNKNKVNHNKKNSVKKGKGLSIMLLIFSLQTTLFGHNIYVEKNYYVYNNEHKSSEYNTKDRVQSRSFHIHINDVKFANVDEYQKIIDPYGSILHTDILYLRPKIYFDYENSNSRDIEIMLSYNIVKPDRTVSKIDPYDRYTLSTGIVLNPNKHKDQELELKGWGNKSGTIYKEPGEYEFQIWISGQLVYSQSFYVKEVITPSLHIKDVKFTSAKKSYGTKDSYSSMLYTNMPFLKPKIYFDYINNNAHNTKETLSYNIINPNGIILKNNKSGKYTLDQEIELDAGGDKDRELELKGSGHYSGTMYRIPGEYLFEIWVSGQKLYSTSFNVRNINEPGLQIKDVKFANVNQNERIIDPFGSTLYTNTTYLKPKIYFDYDNATKENIKMSIAYNVIKPNGEIITTLGMDGYSFLDEVILRAGGRENQEFQFTGLGRSEGTLYKTPGKYTFEVWVSGQKLYSTSFKVIAK